MGEDLYELPDGWVWASLDEITENIIDCLHSTPKFLTTGKYCIDTTCIAPGKILFNKVRYVSEQTYKERTQRLVPQAGDILFAREGTIGTSVVVPNNIELCLGQRMMMFRPSKCITSTYYLWALTSPAFENQWKPKVTGTTSPHVNIRDLRIMILPLPPLPEQYRIVAKIEELFTQLDAGVELLKKVKAKLKRYRQAVLKAAVEGNLTKEWRTAHQGELEPASVLLERILKQRREKWEAEQLAKMQAQGKTPKDDSWKLKYKEPISPDTSDLPELPDGWCWASLEELSDSLRSITYGVIKLGEHIESGVPTLRSSNVRHLKLDLNGIKKIEPELSNQYQRTILKGGEILITIRGTLGGIISVSDNCAGYNISREVAMIAPSKEILSGCYAIILASINIQNWLFSRTKGIAYTGINLETLNQTPVPLFSLTEQELIILEVHKNLSIIDQLEKTVDTNIKRAEKLRQSILKQAFTGQLVPQDPTDEPAEKLLERIKAEKAQQVTTKTKKKTKSQPKSAAQLALPLD